MKVLSPKGARKSTEEDAFGSPMEGKRSALRIPRPGRKHKHAIKDLPDAEADDEILKTWGMTVAQEVRLFCTSKVSCIMLDVTRLDFCGFLSL